MTASCPFTLQRTFQTLIALARSHTRDLSLPHQTKKAGSLGVKEQCCRDCCTSASHWHSFPFLCKSAVASTPTPSLLAWESGWPLTANSALANEHAKCYCIWNKFSHRSLTDKACEIYRTTMKIFEKDSPESVNTTMLFHVCATIAPKDGGRVRYVSGFGGKEFKEACIQAMTTVVLQDASGGEVGSKCSN
ncbi:hypothetical protein CSHISOI_07895 [Colletotrichum shisoi]|uniref:Uncharacterized protein n=1 Tax=Colletotrichum shisoi TaxID=2078593 RepID=A0A5Q4BLX6_9PEZI|nr:hypothetical protein CSHISOI_07895 [Colletotrichum shisoi]